MDVMLLFSTFLFKALKKAVSGNRKIGFDT